MNKPILTFSFLVFIFLCKLSVLSAQFSKNGALYASTEYRINPFPGEENESTANKNIFMLEYIHKDSKSIIIEYSNDNTVSLNSIFTQLPSDLMYQSFGNKELDSLAAFGSFSDAYSDQTLIKTASIMFGKVNYLNQKRTLRANMSAGIGISTNNKYEQWKRRDNSEGGYNYSWETLQHTSVSLVLNPKLEFPFTRFIGLYLSARVQINRNFSFVRFGVGASIGILRTRTDAKD